jgi:hypothetical protein
MGGLQIEDDRSSYRGVDSINMGPKITGAAAHSAPAIYDKSMGKTPMFRGF